MSLVKANSPLAIRFDAEAASFWSFVPSK